MKMKVPMRKLTLTPDNIEFHWNSLDLQYIRADKCTRRQAVAIDTVIQTERMFFEFIVQGQL